MQKNGGWRLFAKIKPFILFSQNLHYKLYLIDQASADFRKINRENYTSR